MAMSKADVLALVDSFLLKPDTSGEADEFYDEVVRELGFLEFLTGVREVSVVAHDPQYRIGVDTIRVLESHLGHSGRLDPVSGRALRASNGAEWRTQRGTPYHITRVDESSNVVRLFPVPVNTDILTLIRTEAPDDVPYWLELPIALEVFARMLVRESPQRDLEMATAAKRLSAVLLILLGLRQRDFARSPAPTADQEI